MASQRTPLYHYRVKDKIVGPICLTDLPALLVSKKILPDTMIREEHSQCWMPVSYTHLDVYKRQVIYCRPADGNHPGRQPP